MKHDKNTRMCAACRERRDKETFFRIARPAGGTQARIDFAGKMQGRGAYICKNEACIAKAMKTRVLARNLGCAVSGELYEEMMRLLKEK
jgi:hypothetical protein